MGGLIGGLFGGGKSKSSSYNAQAVAEFRKVQLPTLEQLQYEIQPYEMEELIKTPLLLDTADLQLADSSLKEIQISPEVLAAQQDVLGRMEEVSREGLTAQERADLARLAMEEKATERGQREAILQQAAERGVLGGGSELAAQLFAQQAGAGRAAQRGFDVAALAKQRALEALTQKGALAERLRGQEYGEKSEAAKAADAIARFNVEQERATREGNIQRQMAAAAERQRIGEANIEAQRAKAAMPVEAQKWLTQAEMEKAAGISGQFSKAAQTAASEDAARKQQQSSMLSAGLTAAGMFFSDERMKENVEPVNKVDVDEFLSKLTGYKYNYKRPEMDGGSTGGVMAQDLEESEMGEGTVVDTPAGKMVDGGKLIGAVTASLSNINDRLKALEERKRGQ